MGGNALNASGFNTLAAMLAVCFAFSPFATPAGAEPIQLAVTHFDNRTAMKQLDYLSQQLPEMIVTELAQYDGLVLLERERVDRLLEERHDIRMDTEAGIVADVILTGFIEKNSAGLMLSMELVEPARAVDSPWIVKRELTEQTVPMDAFTSDLARLVRTRLGITNRKSKPPTAVPPGKTFHLAVLYLNDNSPLAERLALQKGLTDLLIHSLDVLPNLAVLEREDIPDIVNERILAMSGVSGGSTEGTFGNLDAIILGTYMTQRDPRVLRVDLRMVRPATGQILGAQRFRSAEDGVAGMEKEMVGWILSILSLPPPGAGSRSGGRSLESLHYYSQALDHLDNGNILPAVRAIKGALYIDPDYAHAHFAVGKIYEENLGEYALAAEAYSRVADDSSSVHREAALIRLGQVSVVHGVRMEDGKTALDRLLHEFPSTLYADLAFFLLAKRCENDGNSDSAIQFYSTVSSRFPQSPLAQVALKEIAQLRRPRHDAFDKFAPTTFHDNFSSGLDRWEQSVGSWFVLEGNELTYVTNEGSPHRYWIQANDLKPRSFVIEADLIGPLLDGGLTARFAGRKKYVAFIVRQSRRHKDFMWIENNGAKRPQAHGKRRWTRPAGDRVRLKLKITNIKIEAFINGKKVSEYIDKHNLSGPPGLNVWPFGDQRFDNVVIHLSDDRPETAPVFKVK